jgi:hypothetical protein
MVIWRSVSPYSQYMGYSSELGDIDTGLYMCGALRTGTVFVWDRGYKHVTHSKFDHRSESGAQSLSMHSIKKHYGI